MQHKANARKQEAMNKAIKERIRRVPWFLKLIRRVRYMVRSVRVLAFNEPLMRLAESYLRRFYTFDTQRLWESPHPPPEWFDHRANLFRWSELRLPYWVERGAYSCEPMFSGCRVLDLCCGDGFYAYYFYSSIASRIDAVDRDPKAIRHAKKWHHHPNIQFVQLDAVSDAFPMAEYDVIC
jgi:methylase of polypeptide subunit release factors